MLLKIVDCASDEITYDTIKLWPNGKDNDHDDHDDDDQYSTQTINGEIRDSKVKFRVKLLDLASKCDHILSLREIHFSVRRQNQKTANIIHSQRSNLKPS